jgi:hypothetical protein
VDLDRSTTEPDCPGNGDVGVNDNLPPYPHCSSFEYSNNGVNGGIRSAAVADIEHTFWSGRVDSNGIAIHYIEITEPLLYFWMSPSILNGRAATLSAEALNNAISDTEDWFRNNFEANSHELGAVFRQNLTYEMAFIGGGFSTVPYFEIRNPAPYVTSVFSTGNCD